MAKSSVPAKTAYSRVFVINGQARPDHVPSYESGLKAGAVSQGFGDTTKIEIPDPNNYGKFLEVDSFEGASERPSTSLIGRFPSDMHSTLLALARAGCKFDVQVHFGACTDPSSFNTFTKDIVLEGVKITNLATDDVGALSSDEQAVVNETADISAESWYEVLGLFFSTKADDLVTTEVIDVKIIDTQSCGDCTIESDGAKKLFAVTVAAGGSPGTPPDVLCSIDKGATWKADDIDTLATTKNPTGIDGIGDYVAIISNDDLSINYALKSDFNSKIDPAFTKVTTGLVTGKGPLAIKSVGAKAFIAGSGGYVYFTDDVTAGVSVLNAGIITTQSLLCVDALDEYNAIAGGSHGTIIYTKNQVDWQASASTPVGVGIHINCIAMKSESEWWVGCSNGALYYTLNAGISWTAKALPGTTPTAIRGIKFSTNSVLYVATTVSAKGKMFRSYNGGQSFAVTPEASGGTIPSCTRINAIDAVPSDANFVLGGGLNGTDGIIIMGQD